MSILLQPDDLEIRLCPFRDARLRRHLQVRIQYVAFYAASKGWSRHRQVHGSLFEGLL